MIGTSFFRANKEKCPKCGTFGVEESDKDTDVEDLSVCPTCSTRFNEYFILQEGREVEFNNH